MALLCSICERHINRDWYCYRCYHKYKEDIESKKPWAKFLQNEEKKRRRQPVMWCLGSNYDISNDGRIVINSYGWQET